MPCAYICLGRPEEVVGPRNLQAVISKLKLVPEIEAVHSARAACTLS